MDRLIADERFCRERLQELTDLAEQKLSKEQFEKLSEEDIARFLVARGSNVQLALQQLMKSVQWGEKALVHKYCTLCQQDPTSHSHIPIGVLEGDEPSTIVYGCPARAINSTVDPIVHHVAVQLEHCFASSSTGSRWVWCVDFNGFGIKEATQGKLAAKFAMLFSDHMPERLHKIVLLNPPSVFRILLQAAKPFSGKRTLDKIVPITGSNVENMLKSLKTEHKFPPATLKWLGTVLNQSIPSVLPPLPLASKSLLLPSLVPVFDFEVTRGKQNQSVNSVRVSTLISGKIDIQNQVQFSK